MKAVKPESARKSRGVDGSRWAFMKRFNIPDASNPKRTYLSRLRVIQTPYGGIYLHKILTNDGDRDLHNHPYSFIALILRGGYTEDRVKSLDEAIEVAHPLGYQPPKYTWKPGSFHRVSIKDFHSIKTVRRVPTWTLLFVGPRRQNWGFATADGFVPWQEYVKNEAMEQPSLGGS